MSASEATRAACLTPPAAGGVAVIQIVGPDAPALLGPFLRSKRALDLASLAPDELRLCRFVEGPEIIDEVLVTVRRGDGGEWTIDLNLHGGPRIVQRVLMALRGAGVAVAAANETSDRLWSPRDAIEADTLAYLLHARTRDVIRWLLRAGDALREAIAGCERQIGEGKAVQAAQQLDATLASGAAVRSLLRGARIVVTGRPNAGKSSLVNRLAAREQILVSAVPGTTRDFVEAPAAIDGVPLLLVDTAGLRVASDPLEQEAIARARLQLETADLILHVIDASAPPDAEDTIASAPGQPAGRVLRVWNKVDRPFDPAQAGQIAPGDLRISALTGEGLADLRSRVLAALGLSGWSERLPAAFTQRQVELLTTAANALRADPPDGQTAQAALRRCVCGSSGSCDALPSGGV